MNSAIYWGETVHYRRSPKTHKFKYPLFSFALDLDELEEGFGCYPIFSHNRFGIFSLLDTDYVSTEKKSIRLKIEEFLSKEGKGRPRTITLITMPRCFGYIFNPVNFYLCEDESGCVLAVIAEVSNTFGDKHIYCLAPEGREPRLPVRFNFPKDFYVSPFFGVSGGYTLTWTSLDNRLDITVMLEEEGERVFYASLYGRRRPLTAPYMLGTLVLYPFAALATTLRITIQAIKLYIGNKAKIFEKPQVTSAYTVITKPGWLHKRRLAILDALRKQRERHEL